MAIIVGLDGTLARHEWRNELIETEGWQAYYQAAERDAPNRPIVEVVNAMQRKGHHVFCVSPRPEMWRMLTLRWLVRHEIRVDTLLLRPENDWSTEDQLRAIMHAQIKELCSDVVCMIDENEKACNFWRAAGLPVLQLTNANGGT